MLIQVFPLMINNCLEGKNLPIYGDGKNVRDWLYVKDHAKAIDMVINDGKLGNVYNVGGHNEKKNIDIVNIILETLQEILPKNDIRRQHISKNLITYYHKHKKL